MDLRILNDKRFLQKYTSLAGIDEAGRGPWAGPVVIAGVIVKQNDLKFCEDINDSKKLSPCARENLYTELVKIHKYSVEIVENTIIDSIGISNSITQSIWKIITDLKADYNIIDGYFKKEHIPANSECIIRGDSLNYSIGAASIIAKYTRDRIMEDLDKTYPLYNFKKNKGYGTKEHIENINKHGITPVHRLSYKPVKLFMAS